MTVDKMPKGANKLEHGDAPMTPPQDDDEALFCSDNDEDVTQDDDDLESTPQNGLSLYNIKDMKSMVKDSLDLRFTQDKDDENVCNYENTKFDSYWKKTHNGKYMKTRFYIGLEKGTQDKVDDWKEADTIEKEAKLAIKEAEGNPSLALSLRNKISTVRQAASAKASAKFTAQEILTQHKNKAKKLLDARQKHDKVLADKLKEAKKAEKERKAEEKARAQEEREAGGGRGKRRK